MQISVECRSSHVQLEANPERDDRKRRTRDDNRCPLQRSSTDRTILENGPTHLGSSRVVEARSGNPTFKRPGKSIQRELHFQSALCTICIPVAKNPVSCRTADQRTERETEDADEQPLRPVAPEAHVRTTVALIFGRGVLTSPRLEKRTLTKGMDPGGQGRWPPRPRSNTWSRRARVPFGRPIHAGSRLIVR